MENKTTKHAIYKVIAADESGVLADGMMSYSGRCMYGRECLAIRANDINEVMSNLITTSMELAAEGHLDFDDRTAIGECLVGLRTDSLGRGIVVYFPSIEYTHEEEQEG